MSASELEKGVGDFEESKDVVAKDGVGEVKERPKRGRPKTRPPRVTQEVREELKEELKEELPVKTPLPPPQPSVVGAPDPIQIMTPQDSHVKQRISSQPKTLEEVKLRTTPKYTPGKHRLSLPDFFEGQSYDCTQGEGCPVHLKDNKGQVRNRGEFVFKRLWKHKRALDEAMDQKHWILVSRTYFPEAPNHLFQANGGVEEGDSLLAFMPAAQALAIRYAPGKHSNELVKAQLTQHHGDDRFYTPKLGEGEEGPEEFPGMGSDLKEPKVTPPEYR